MRQADRNQSNELVVETLECEVVHGIVGSGAGIDVGGEH